MSIHPMKTTDLCREGHFSPRGNFLVIYGICNPIFVLFNKTHLICFLTSYILSLNSENRSIGSKVMDVFQIQKTESCLNPRKMY